MSTSHASRPTRVLVSTSWGDIRIHLRGRHVVDCCLPKVPEDGSLKPLRMRGMKVIPGSSHDPRSAEAAAQFVCATLEGCPPAVPPLALEGRPFSRRVWKALLRIPRGKVRSYGQLARGLGRPGAARAGGRACGANPIPLFVPCHRVVAADGGLGGFSSGLAWKRWLLRREGVSVPGVVT